MQHETYKPERVLRLREVLQRTGCGKSSFYEMLNNNEFPPGIRVTRRNRGWLESEVEAWIKSRPAATSDVRERGLTAA